MADALPMLPVNDSKGRLNAVSTVQPNWLSDVIQSYDQDTEAQALTEGLVVKNEAYK